MNYEEYKAIISDDIATCMDSMGVQPILFFGSGMSQRYLGAPSWDGLMEKLAEMCPRIDKSIAYYKQKHGSLIDIGTEFSDCYREWAWEEPSKFREENFEPDQPADIYIKETVSDIFKALMQCPKGMKVREHYENEISVLQSVSPYAIITTNYDSLLEEIFSGYTPVIGQEILRANYASVGEIIKIHGCSSMPNSIVLTGKDYEEFSQKKKYLSAKLLTFFAEHPLVILGYSAQDPNIKAILSDIDEILSPDNELIPNIYLIEWDKNAEATGKHPQERLIPIEDNRSIRVKSIMADSFEWIFNALASNEAIQGINPKLLRSVLARTYNLVRHDIPRKTVEVNFEILEKSVSSDKDFAKLYGITTLNDPSAFNATYPYTITQVGKELGYKSWHNANVLIKDIKEKHGVDIKASDNKYHIAIKVGISQTHKYSNACLKLLKKERDMEEYELDMDSN
jgi:hypothetical protein